MLTIALGEIWDGTWDFIFRIQGMSDSKYTKDESRHSVNVWLNDIRNRSRSWRTLYEYIRSIVNKNNKRTTRSYSATNTNDNR